MRVCFTNMVSSISAARGFKWHSDAAMHCLKWNIALVLLGVFAGCGLLRSSGATLAENVGRVDWLTPDAEKSIERGLVYLASHQHPDGSFGSGAYRGNVAVTSLAGMAFLAEGSLPGRGRFGKELSRALDYVLGQCRENGLILNVGAASRGPMYEHGFATLFLAECWGSSSRPDLKDKLTRAVRLIVNTQNDEGGWRYQPQKLDADISVTVCQIMALRAARNAGIYVPKTTVDRCVAYVRRCQNPDGGFRYMTVPGESAFARSAAAMVALFSAGIYEGEEIDRGINYLLRFVPEPGVIRQEPYYYYGHYYCVQAMWQKGGAAWHRYFPAIRDDLIARQQPDGSWSDPISPELGTAMALLVLQLPYQYLPIFER